MLVARLFSFLVFFRHLLSASSNLTIPIFTMAPANTRVRASSSQRPKRGKSARPRPGKPRSTEPATHDSEKLSVPVIISSSDESSDDDGLAQTNTDNSGSLGTKELIPGSGRFSLSIFALRHY